MNINEVLKSISSEVLTEEVKKSIEEAFNTAVENKVNDVVDLEVKNALEKLDEEHLQKAKKLIEAIDVDHKNKLVKVLEAIDVDHTKKIKMIVEKYEKELKEHALASKQELIQNVSKFMDLYLEKAIPQKEIKEAVENIKSKKIINEIKKILAFDPDCMAEDFKNAIKEGKETIDSLRKELNEKIKENIRLNESLSSTKSSLLIEQKTIGFNKEKRKYIEKLLKNKSANYIEENFDYIIKMFDREEEEKIEILAEEEKRKSHAMHVDTPASPLKEEVDSSSEIKNIEIDRYLEFMKKF